MDKKIFKSIFLLITYTILLTIVVVKFDDIYKWFALFFSYFKPFIWGFVLAFILNKPIKFLNSKLYKIFKFKKQNISLFLSIFITYTLFIGLIVSLMAFIIPQLSDSISLFINNINSYSKNIEKMVNSIIAYLNLQNFSIVDLTQIIQDNMQKISDIASQLLTSIVSMTAGIAMAFINIFIGLIFSIYIMSSKNKLLQQINLLVDAYLPHRFYNKTKQIAKLTNETFNNFVSGQLFEAFILGCMCFIGMTIFRFEYAPLISVLIAVTSIIPVIGAFLGAIPSAFILLMVSPIKAFWFVIFLIIIQQIEGNFIYPKVVGNKIGLPAIWVLLAIIVGGGLFGIVGILLGVPICSILYTLIKDGAKKRSEHRKTIGIIKTNNKS
jgi:predicted PurR-regulated permease PerM